MAGKSVTWPNASPAEPEAAAGCWVENQAIAAANDAQWLALIKQQRTGRAHEAHYYRQRNAACTTGR